MFLEDAHILFNGRLQGDYYRIDLAAPQIVTQVQPGQFVHVRLPVFHHRVLRRPFSIFSVDPAAGILSVIYKVVGEGTQHLSQLAEGVIVNLLGPLGRGYTLPPADSTAIVVAGGYGCAATYLLVSQAPPRTVCLLGGRTAADLLLVDEYDSIGANVRLATDDGSRGHAGVVTDLLEDLLKEQPDNPRVYACGPNPMLKQVSSIVQRFGLDAEISLDHAMCCGVGACFACVVKQKADTAAGWEYVRTCKEGPVFKASQTVWE